MLENEEPLDEEIPAVPAWERSSICHHNLMDALGRSWARKQTFAVLLMRAPILYG